MPLHLFLVLGLGVYFEVGFLLGLPVDRYDWWPSIWKMTLFWPLVFFKRFSRFFNI
jgi:hypothetical protein